MSATKIINPFLQLAKQAIEEYVNKKNVLPLPPNLPSEMKQRAGVFVSLHKKSDHSLRGCIGTYFPTCKNIGAEIIQNAISACSTDPRFPAVTPNELQDLEITVDILSEPEPFPQNPVYLSSLDELPSSLFSQFLNPKKYGLIIKSLSGQVGLLLPDIREIKTPQQQIEICCQKAGIQPDESVEIYRFTVKRHKE